MDAALCALVGDRIIGMKFHVFWHGLPENCAEGPDWQSPFGPIRTLRPTSNDLALPWPVSFEQGRCALERLGRLFAEPDGSFVWRPADGEQVDGQCYDRDGQLLYLELRGDCSGLHIERLKDSLVPSDLAIGVQLARDGIFLAWSDWRTLWSRDKTRS